MFLIKIDYTMLDCIFNYELQTYYVIDVLVYKSHPVLDSEVNAYFIICLHFKILRI